MRKAFVVFLLIGPAMVCHASPCGGPFTLVGAIVVGLASLALEGLLTTGILLFCGMTGGMTFLILLGINIGCYIGVYAFLEWHWRFPMFWALMVAALVETACLKLLSRFDLFTRDDFNALLWRYALLAAVVGKLYSFYMLSL